MPDNPQRHGSAWCTIEPTNATPKAFVHRGIKDTRCASCGSRVETSLRYEPISIGMQK